MEFCVNMEHYVCVLVGTLAVGVELRVAITTCAKHTHETL